MDNACSLKQLHQYFYLLQANLSISRFNKKISAITLVFAIFDKWHPHGTGFLCNFDMWKKFIDFYCIGLGRIVPDVPTTPIWFETVYSLTHSVTGRITPKTLLSGAITGRLAC